MGGKDSREYAAAVWEAEQAQKQEAERQQLVKEIFTMFDADGNGKLSKNEYKSYLIGIGMFGPYADDYDSKGWAENCEELDSSTEEGISWDAFESKLYGPEHRGRGDALERLDQAKVDLSNIKYRYRYLGTWDHVGTQPHRTQRLARRAGQQWRARARQGGQAGGMSAPEYREMEIAKAEEAARMRKEAVANLNAVLDDSGATVESVAAAIAGAGEDELAYREPELLNRAQGKLLELKEAAGKKGKGRFWRAKSG